MKIQCNICEIKRDVGPTVDVACLMCYDKLKTALQNEAQVNTHMAVLFFNLLAQHGTPDEMVWARELGYGKMDTPISEICGSGLKVLAEAGNKNAQSGKPDLFPHPILEQE